MKNKKIEITVKQIQRDICSRAEMAMRTVLCCTGIGFFMTSSSKLVQLMSALLMFTELGCMWNMTRNSMNVNSGNFELRNGIDRNGIRGFVLCINDSDEVFYPSEIFFIGKEIEKYFVGKK